MGEPVAPTHQGAARVLQHTLEQDLTISHAVDVLVHRYDLTTAEAFTFLQDKAAEDTRDAVEVAEEVLRHLGLNPRTDPPPRGPVSGAAHQRPPETANVG